MEEQSVTTATNPEEAAPTVPPPQVIALKTGSNRSALWTLLGVGLGFSLPVLMCGFLFMAGIIGLGVAGAAAGGGTSTTTSSGFGDAVAVVRVEGVITHSDSSEFSSDATSGRVIADLEAAANDDSVKAIILRVDSPGGTVTGSAQIYETIKGIDKPVVVSMAGVAASGGYYISAPADYIIARPDTTTGSLGVVLTLYDAQELSEKVGIKVNSITSGPNKTIGSPWEDMTAEQQEILEAFIDESYDEFVRIIADGRNLDEETVLELADGRIYSGRQALEVGLVDELGNFDDAVAKAAALGGIAGEPRIVEYEHLPSFQDLLLSFSSQLQKNEADRVMEIVSEFTTPKLEYRYVGPGSQ